MVGMGSKTDLREHAVRLRREGFSYGEILDRVPVAKSTLAGWLHGAHLSRHQKQRLTRKKLLSAIRGGQIKHEQRIARTRAIVESAKKEIGPITERELWLIGIALYWAEGSKEKDSRPGSGVRFTNSDGRMVRLFLQWLSQTCDIAPSEIGMDIMIHENHRHRLREIIAYWSVATGFPESHFTRIYWKRNQPKTRRLNTGQSYYGTVKVKVRASSIFHRKIAGWIEGCSSAIGGWCNGNTPGFEPGESRSDS